MVSPSPWSPSLVLGGAVTGSVFISFASNSDDIWNKVESLWPQTPPENSHVREKRRELCCKNPRDLDGGPVGEAVQQKQTKKHPPLFWPRGPPSHKSLTPPHDPRGHFLSRGIICFNPNQLSSFQRAFAAIILEEGRGSTTGVVRRTTSRLSSGGRRPGWLLRTMPWRRHPRACQ